MIDDARVAEVRAEHRPRMRNPGCECGGWECGRCLTVWPCDFEKWLRESGVAPIGIGGYEVHATGQ